MPERVLEIVEQILNWTQVHVLTLDSLQQLGVILVALAISFFMRRGISGRLQRREADDGLWPLVRRFCGIINTLTLPLLWLGWQWMALLVLAGLEQGTHILSSVNSLLTAWVAIRIITSFLRSDYWSRVVTVIAWTIAALNILHLLQPTTQILNDLAFNFGDVRISALGVIKGVLAAVVLLWIAAALSRFVEDRLRRSAHITPSFQVLTTKLAKVAFFALAILMALSAMGINLTAFAVFGGAVGVGIGFGLQKVVSNLISGVILLLDRSIKPGDVIEVGMTYGRINSLGARYASVVTRDGTEYLIPNEDLITQRVVNWSFSSPQVRVRLPIGISYSSDVPVAIGLIKQAAASVERVLADPAPNCLMTGFGDSSIDLELRFWIDDPENGMGNVKSAVLLAIWATFREHGVEVPFPQREVTLKSQEQSAAAD